MTNLRRVLALPAVLAVGALVVTATLLSASARTVDERCVGHGPIAASTLAPGAAAPGCSLVGRVVTDGRVAVVVPPPGMTVAGAGVGRHGESRSLQVTNTGSTVRAVSDAGVSSSQRGAAARRASSPPACKDRAFHLEHHKWAKSLRYRINVAHKPKGFKGRTVVRQIKAANGNMRKGRTTCGKPHLKTPVSHYLGRTHARPNIKPGRSSVTCGRANTNNIVGFGNLPGGLLGWTCYWWFANGRMGAADIMMDTGNLLTTHLPRHCTNRWDFEGAVTHEWGHAYGMAHTGSGHANLTMQHLLSPCSPYARTLGLGDWLGMRKMYGAR
jgi:hypothetical protein